jgi:hypothetical protein
LDAIGAHAPEEHSEESVQRHVAPGPFATQPPPPFVRS